MDEKYANVKSRGLSLTTQQNRDLTQDSVYCRIGSVVWFLEHRAFVSLSCKILGTRNKPRQPDAPLRILESGRRQGEKPSMTVRVQNVGVRL
jgi:hypothetical protein